MKAAMKARPPEMPQQRERPPYSFSPETRADLERILGHKPELIARLARSIAPAGFVIGPMFERVLSGQGVKADQWRRLSRALAQLERSLAALNIDAGTDLQTGIDESRELQNADPEIDLVAFAAQSARIQQILVGLLSNLERELKRGRPRGISIDRIWLGAKVAEALHEAGVKITRGRDGILARTLEVMFDVAKLGVPADMMDCLRIVARNLEVSPRMKTLQAVAKPVD